MRVPETSSILEQVRGKIAASKTKDCLSFLYENLKFLNLELPDFFRFRDGILHFQHRYHSLENDRERDIISTTEYRTESSKLAKSIIAFLSNIEENLLSYPVLDIPKIDDKTYLAEIILDKDFDKTTQDELQKIMEEIGKTGKISFQELFMLSKKTGSIIIEVALLAESIVKVKSLLKLGILKDLKGFKVLDSSWGWIEEYDDFHIYLPHADLVGVDLRGKNLVRADFSGANLSDVDLSGANLSESNLIGTNLSKAILNGANLSGAKLNRAGFNGASLKGTNLENSNLNMAEFTNADLRGASFANADLSGTDFTNADLKGTDFTNENLSSVGLKDTIFKKLNIDNLQNIERYLEAQLILCDIPYWHLRLQEPKKQENTIMPSDIWASKFLIYNRQMKLIDRNIYWEKLSETFEHLSEFYYKILITEIRSQGEKTSPTLPTAQELYKKKVEQILEELSAATNKDLIEASNVDKGNSDTVASNKPPKELRN